MSYEMSIEEAVQTTRQELQALKLLVMATIVQTANSAASPQHAKNLVDGIKKMALSGIDNSHFSDQSTAEEWKSKMSAEISKICDAIQIGSK